jgi:5-methylcytosine-specific restriction endonuclease McrA
MTNKTQRDKVLAKSGGHCWYCGIDISEKKWHIDHFLPVLRNTSYAKPTSNPWGYSKEYIDSIPKTDKYTRPENDTFKNKVPSCIQCNLLKSQSTIDGFRKTILKLISSLNKYNNNYRNAKRYGLIKETEPKVTFWFEAHKEK